MEELVALAEELVFAEFVSISWLRTSLVSFPFKLMYRSYQGVKHTRLWKVILQFETKF